MSNSPKQATEQVIVPDIGDADGVEVIEFCVQPGDTVAVDDALVVIESDKASMEIQSTVAGVVAGFSVALGDIVTSGQVIAEISVGNGGAAEDAAEPDQDEARETKDTKAQERPEQPSPKAAAESTGSASSSSRLEVRLPDIGDAGEVVVIELGAAVGDSVDADQMLLVVESDKASMDIVAPAAGVLSELKVSEGDSVGEDALLAILTLAGGGEAKPVPEDQIASDTETETETETETDSVRVSPPASASGPEVRAAPAPQRDASGLAPPPTPTAPPAKVSTVYAGPAVRRMARELGVDLTQLSGTGARGRIVKDDVNLYVKTALASGPVSAGTSSGTGIPAVPEIDFSKFGEISVEPMSRILKRGAANLHRSWLNVVHVTQHDEADITELEEFRKSLKLEGERRGVKITPLAFIAKACAHMLVLHPKFNASLDGAVENLIMKRFVNIGFAVDTPDGLLVPVVRDADRKGVWELAEEIDALAARARDKKLAPQDLQGGTFSISSLGSIGGTGFTPIVNAPEVAILGVAKLAVKPHWNGEAFVPRKMLPLSLSYDHRAINGAEAGRFVTELSALLADMRRLVL